MAIPNQMATGLQPFMTGIQQGGSLYSKIMEPILKREAEEAANKRQQAQLAQAMLIHKQNYGLQQQNYNLARQKAERDAKVYEFEHDPNKQIQYIQNLKRAWEKSQGIDPNIQESMANPITTENSIIPAGKEADYIAGSNAAAGTPGSFQEQAAKQHAQMNGEQPVNPLMANEPPMKQKQPQNPLEWIQKTPGMASIVKKTTGIDFGKATETPEVKRAAQLRDKIAFEKIKNEESRLLKQTELNDKQASEKDKLKQGYEKDLPVLKESLQDIDDAIQIAKNHPKFFGHYWTPDYFAAHENDKDIGKWQTIIFNKIGQAEAKLSQKGNILALKLASQYKPNFSEQQNSAIGKLEKMRNEILNQINHTNKFLKPDTNQETRNIAVNNDDPLGLFGG